MTVRRYAPCSVCSLIVEIDRLGRFRQHGGTAITPCAGTYGDSVQSLRIAVRTLDAEVSALTLPRTITIEATAPATPPNPTQPPSPIVEQLRQLTEAHSVADLYAASTLRTRLISELLYRATILLIRAPRRR